MTDQPTEGRPDRDWLADIIGAAVRHHESWQDCTCSDPDMGECWYHLTDAQQDHWTGDAALRELEAHDLTIIRDEDLGAVSVAECDRRIADAVRFWQAQTEAGHDEIVRDLEAGIERRIDTAVKAERDRWLAIIDRCYACDLPLLHDESEPQLAWWCEGCGIITRAPETMRAAAGIESGEPA